MNSGSKSVVTRFAPSPTGLLHMGNYRTALFSYFYAKKHGGKMLLRIEDTDKERSKKEYEDNIIGSLKWLGLDYGEKFYRQSEHAEAHKNYLKKLVEEGHAYVSKEESKTVPGKINELIRFKNPNKKVSFTDLIRGEVTMDTTELKDFVIAKSFDEPLFHLAVVADDFDMAVTHIIRGEDHISNTPRQILIQEALGAPRPIYAHLPMVLAPDRSKLSKRKGAKPLTWYQDAGFLPEAIINYMALLGWNPGTEQEIFSVEELIQAYNLDKVQKSGAVFDEEKLKWVNKEHLMKIPNNILVTKIQEKLSKKGILSQNMLEKVVPLILERIHSFGDIDVMLETGEIDYMFAAPEFEIRLLYWKAKEDSDATSRRLAKVVEILEAVDENNFKKDIIKDALWDYATAEGRGEVLWPTRVALSGKEKSPDPFVLAELFGKQESLSRLRRALEKVSHVS